MTDLFGPIVSGLDVEVAVTSTLKLWLPTYLAEMERLTSRPAQSIPTPRSWSTVPVFYQFQQDQLPAAVVVSPGTAGEPERFGDGSYSAWWDVSVAVVVAGQTRQNANELAKLYAATIRWIAAQQESMGGFASDTVWVGEANDVAPSDYVEVGWATETQLQVRVDDVVSGSGGPATPDLDPDPYPTVQTTQIVVERTT